MPPDADPPPDTPVLWRIASFGRQRVPAGQPYWWDNHRREPRGLVVVQATLRGSIRYRDGGGDHDVTPGDLLLFAYGEATAYGVPEATLAETYVCHWVCLQGAGLFEHVAAFRRRFGSIYPVGLAHPILGELDTLLDLAEPVAATPAPLLAATIHGLLMRLYEDAEQTRMRQLPPVQRALEFVARQPHLVLSLDTVARRFGCSREHLSRLFREQVGQPPGVYLNAAKTRRALRLLRTTDLPLGSIASQSGFPSVRTMTRHVRATTGQPPTRLRAS